MLACFYRRNDALSNARFMIIAIIEVVMPKVKQRRVIIGLVLQYILKILRAGTMSG